MKVQSNINVLLLTKFGPLGASSRIRCFQYLPALEDNGLTFDTFPLIDDKMLEEKYLKGYFQLRHTIKAYIRRALLLLSSKNYNVVWIHKEVFPYLPAWFDSFAQRCGSLVVLDLDDAEFLKYEKQYSGSSNTFVSKMMSNKYSRLFNSVDKIVVGNSYLKNMICDRKKNNTDIHIIPSVVNTDVYGVSNRRHSQKKLTIGWIGTPYTELYVRKLLHSLEPFGILDLYDFHLVGASDSLSREFGVRVTRWREDTEVSVIQSFDVGIMPLDDDTWERGKCGYKAIQYMACGIPVIVSPVGVNSDIVLDAIVGYHATDPSQWASALNALANDVVLRTRLGAQGRIRVNEFFSIKSQLPELVSILRYEPPLVSR